VKIITCTLPNASTEISGVAFTQGPDGMVSEAVADETAALFSGIPGYTIADDVPPAPAKGKKD
jgi:hypothetical protein